MYVLTYYINKIYLNININHSIIMMKIVKLIKSFVALVILSLIMHSCADNELTKEDKPTIQEDLYVSEELAIAIAKNFASDQAFFNLSRI